MSLRLYAEEHGGWFPYGKRTPEASLGLLAADPGMDYLPAGKCLSSEVVKAALAKDGELGTESCGWHYVEGLREDDNSEIAVVWDKVIGLGHNGERSRGLEHEVVYLDGSHAGVPKAQWAEFVEEQKRLLRATTAKREKGDPPIRWSDEASLGPNLPTH